MAKNNNLNFKTFIPADKFNGIKSLDQKRFKVFIKKVNESIKIKNNVFNSFSKNFKLNFNPKELKSFKKFKRFIIIGIGGSILGSQAVNVFLKKKN